jgi:redox-sensitive bicupin YhaK (pirin superfamily)
MHAKLISDALSHRLGGLDVRRILPAARCRSIGPFVFLDHFGPAVLAEGQGFDVPPHPHIGLATVTYLFAGEIVHRDSLGCEQVIRPGDVNWMTAGRGIVHSERTSAQSKAAAMPIHGLQIWVALPVRHEETAPQFRHHASEHLPRVTMPGVDLRIVAGEVYDARSPVQTLSSLFYVAAELDAGARITLPPGYAERGAYVVEGVLRCAGATISAADMAVFDAGDVELAAQQKSRVMLLGGEPLPGRRYMWWNFVSSSRERIEQAKADWREGRFAGVPGDSEAMPLPEQ